MVCASHRQEKRAGVGGAIRTLFAFVFQKLDLG
jgi:hypothetical protein